MITVPVLPGYSCWRVGKVIGIVYSIVVVWAEYPAQVMLLVGLYVPAQIVIILSGGQHIGGSQYVGKGSRG